MYRAHKIRPRHTKEEQRQAFEHLSRLHRPSPEYTKCLNDIVIHNTGLVLFCMRRVRIDGGHRDFDDFFQVGCMGLMRAAERYDHARGATFATYALYWIKQQIYRHMVEVLYPVRLPAHAYKKGADMAWISMDEFPNMKQKLPSTHYRPSVSTKGLVEVLKKILSRREFYVLTHRFGIEVFPETLQQIGDTLGFTRERVRQWEVCALRRLAIPENRKALGDLWNDVGYGTTYDHKHISVGANVVMPIRDGEDCESFYHNFRHRNQLDNIQRLLEDSKYEARWEWV